MMEHFTYKKVKKHQAEKRAEAEVQSPLLNEEDENFLERIAAEGTPPALPERPHVLSPEVGNSLVLNSEAGDSTNNQAQMVIHNEPGTQSEKGLEENKHKGKGKTQEKNKDKKKSHRFSFLRKGSKKADSLKPDGDVPAQEADKEEDDINRVLDELNLAAVNNRAFSISKESQVIVQKFTVILKDLVNGVPTAYDDLVNLIEDSQGTLAKSYDHLPSFLQKLITSLPHKLTNSFAPELLAVATEAQGISMAAGMASEKKGGGLAGAAKRFLVPTNLKDLVTKPGAVAGMLKTIMNALKLRWPAFIGTNVLLSVGLFVLLFVFWYCHKRGREVRLESERMVDNDGRVVELEDDAMLPPPSAGSGAARISSEDRQSSSTPPRDHRSHHRPASPSSRVPVAQNDMRDRRRG